MSAKKVGSVNILWIVALFLIMISCESADQRDPVPDEPGERPAFPDFITPNKVYFDLRIAGDHNIDSNYYHLKISGGADHPAVFSLEELRNLEMAEKTLTVECIGNPATLIQSMDQDNVWVFWEAVFTLSPGPLTIRAKATGEDGRTQPREDENYLDGTNAWPKVTVVVTDGS